MEIWQIALLLFLLGIVIGRILKKKQREINRLKLEKDIMSSIIRASNIKNVPPKDLQD